MVNYSVSVPADLRINTGCVIKWAGCVSNSFLFSRTCFRSFHYTSSSHDHVISRIGGVSPRGAGGLITFSEDILGFEIWETLDILGRGYLNPVKYILRVSHICYLIFWGYQNIPVMKISIIRNWITDGLENYAKKLIFWGFDLYSGDILGLCN